MQIISDVHLELNRTMPEIVPRAPYLALLGDIGDPFERSYRAFVEKCAAQFERVFVIAGNHEFYGNDYQDTLRAIHDVCDTMRNVTFLQNSTYTLMHNETEIIVCGTILWSNIMPHAFAAMSDCDRISHDGVTLTRGRYLSWHRESVDYIEKVITSATPSSNIIILSHHAPHPAMNGRYGQSAISSGFTTDLTRLLKRPIRAWLSGHTHQSMSITYGPVKLMANCYGYDSEHDDEPYDDATRATGVLELEI